MAVSAQYLTAILRPRKPMRGPSPMEGSNKGRFFAVFASATNYVAGRSRKGGGAQHHGDGS